MYRYIRQVHAQMFTGCAGTNSVIKLACHWASLILSGFDIHKYLLMTGNERFNSHRCTVLRFIQMSLVSTVQLYRYTCTWDCPEVDTHVYIPVTPGE